MSKQTCNEQLRANALNLKAEIRNLNNQIAGKVAYIKTMETTIQTMTEDHADEVQILERSYESKCNEYKEMVERFKKIIENMKRWWQIIIFVKK